MDEQKFEACSQVTQELLDCSSNEEAYQILGANLELIHNGLIPFIVEFAAVNEDDSEQLINKFSQLLLPWATMVLPQMEIGQAQDTAETVANFSQSIWQSSLRNKPSSLSIIVSGYEVALTILTQETFPTRWAQIQGELGLIYSDTEISNRRADDFEQAIVHFQAALAVFTPEEYLQQWAITQNNLGETYRNRISGKRSTNLEQAISYFQSALDIFTYEEHPQQWALLQSNLGDTYSDYYAASYKSENLELAIFSYKQALQVFSKELHPLRWARINNSMGDLYRQREVDRAGSLELAIDYYSKALEIHTRPAFPKRWAKIFNNLGFIYIHRIRGKTAENLEQGIQHFLYALEVFTREKFPQEWAILQSNLGEVYRQRILGEEAENLERAIRYHLNALEVLSSEIQPEKWAMAKTNLGIAYANYSRGRKESNLEQAIQCLSDALTVFTYENFPEKWATVKLNLGMAYLNRLHENRNANLEQAIQYFSDAFKVFTYEKFPRQWAQVQSNLGMAYRNFPLKNGENLEKSICCHLSALQVHTRQDFPKYWAMAQMNLGAAHFQRYHIKKDETEELTTAIHCYLSALEIFTRETFPQRYAEVQDNLGIAYKENQQFIEAYTAFDAAIDIVEEFRQEILFGSAIEGDKKNLAEKWNQLYQNIVDVCLDLGQYDRQYYSKAIEYVERSKTRNLVEQILSRDLKTIFPPEVVTQLEQYRDDIAVGQYQIQHGEAENPGVLVQHLQELRQQRNKLQNCYLPIGSGFDFEHFWQKLDNHIAVVEFYITGNRLLTFIFIHQTQQPIIVQSQPQDLENLSNWIDGYLQGYYTQKNDWKSQLSNRLHSLAQILHIDDIIQQIPSECDRLILIPHRYLHLFPLHALPINSQQGKLTSEILMHRFPLGVSYAPSCQLLELSQTRKRFDFTHLFAVQNPTDDLYYTNIEIDAIKSYFNPVATNILVTKDATKAAIDNKLLNTFHCAHLSCHGYFNLKQPQKSALILADAHLSPAPNELNLEHHLLLDNGEVIDLDKCLTLDAVFALKLDKCRLVTLSACETGLIDFTNISDEYIGLPSGFLVAGSPAVVSSLWTVNDLSTALLMIKFYENLHHQMSLAVALNQAQLWLRDASRTELTQWIKAGNLPLSPALRISLFKGLKPDDKPFHHPFHWAAFCAIGQ